MAQENKEYEKNNSARVDRIMNFALRHGVRFFIFRQYKEAFPNNHLDMMENAPSRRIKLRNKEDALKKLDIQAWLKLMNQNWDNVCGKKLSYTARGYVNELRDVRTDKSHVSDVNTFTDKEAHHIATTAIKLLEAIDKSETVGDSKAKEQIPIIQNIEVELGRLIYGGEEQKAAEKSARANNNHRSSTDSHLDVEFVQVKVKDKEDQMQATESEFKQSSDSSSNHRFKPDKQTTAEEVESLERTSHADDAIQQLIRQHHEMMRHIQRQQASHLKTTASANADVIQLLFRQNQEFMQHMQQMQASQPAAPANADVIQLLIPLIRQNQVFMQQGGVTSDDAVQQLIRQNQAFMQHVQQMQQQQQMQTSQPIININPNISPNINPSISANAGDQVTYAPSAPTTVIAERNNAAFVVGVLGGLFGLLGIAHIFNHKAGRGLVYLFIGTVCYWIFLLLLLSALVNIGSSLWIAAVAIHLVIIWQHAKRGAGSASANQTRESKRK